MAKSLSSKDNQAAKIIYDLGANVGSNLEYYLKKADKVIAVEANPILIETLREKFSSSISVGKLVVEHAVISADKSAAVVPFYIHKSNNVLSQFPKPQPKNIDEFDCVSLPSKSVAEIINKHGAPWYIKIDLESYDSAVLKAIFDSNIRPPFISAEAHHPDILIILAGLGGYKAFQLIDGDKIPYQFRNYLVHTSTGTEKHSFVSHSAGPCCDDLDKRWLTTDNIMAQLVVERFGWKDIHATTEYVATESCRPHSGLLRVARFIWRLGRALRYPVSIIFPKL
jgi:FkbM family methyltransferase